MATEILLPRLIYDRCLVSKMVFTPNPTTNDFLAAVICDINGFACITAGARRWDVLDPIRLDDGDQIADLLYHRNDLPPELVCCIADGLDDLKCYASAHGTCPIWRSTLTPPSPSLLLDHNDDPAKRCITTAIKHHTDVASILTLSSSELNNIPSGKTCLGCSGGWLALSVCINGGHSLLSLFHPIMAAKILLASLIYDGRLVSNMVFEPSPTSDDFLAAMICDVNRLAYITTRARMRVILDHIRLAEGDQIANLLYHRNCMVNCITRFGDVHVLRLPQHHRREPIILEGHTLAHLVVHGSSRCTGHDQI
ncbi:uncharacterized protein LOC119280363 [Triticum dicoccoides]|uniref:uncharacterized protein LOC119280363 n=1 Tax=Triticum dicoccoides TaxID=85692 RepID=UPI001890A249|nr:uncharacterized protein LOC119280363 [Triticum dicoccoides]